MNAIRPARGPSTTAGTSGPRRRGGPDRGQQAGGTAAAIPVRRNFSLAVTLALVFAGTRRSGLCTKNEADQLKTTTVVRQARRGVVGAPGESINLEPAANLAIARRCARLPSLEGDRALRESSGTPAPAKVSKFSARRCAVPAVTFSAERTVAGQRGSGEDGESLRRRGRQEQICKLGTKAAWCRSRSVPTDSVVGHRQRRWDGARVFEAATGGRSPS